MTKLTAINNTKNVLVDIDRDRWLNKADWLFAIMTIGERNCDDVRVIYDTNSVTLTPKSYKR